MSEIQLLLIAAQYYKWRAETHKNDADMVVAEWLAENAEEIRIQISHGGSFRLGHCDEPHSMEKALAVAAKVMARNPHARRL